MKKSIFDDLNGPTRFIGTVLIHLGGLTQLEIFKRFFSGPGFPDFGPFLTLILSCVCVQNVWKMTKSVYFQHFYLREAFLLPQIFF